MRFGDFREIAAFTHLARTNNTMIVPANVSDVAGMIATAMTVLDKSRAAPAAGQGTPQRPA